MGGPGGPMGGPGGPGMRGPPPQGVPPGQMPLNTGGPRPAGGMGNLFGDPLSGQKPPGR